VSECSTLATGKSSALYIVHDVPTILPLGDRALLGVRKVQREKCTSAAVAQLRSILALAEEREVMLKRTAQ